MSTVNLMPENNTHTYALKYQWDYLNFQNILLYIKILPGSLPLPNVSVNGI